MAERTPHIAIIGGGISGLSTAFYARKFSRERGLPVQITLLERSDNVGGKIKTLRKDGFVIEKGPDSFLARKLPIVDLTRDLGIEEQFVATNPQAKKTYVVHGGKLHRLPPGLALGVPTSMLPFVKSGLISPLGKARAAMDLILPKRQGTDDESLGGFLTRRLGREVLDRIAEPLLAGIYAGDTFALSLQATFPQFQAIEQKSRSLILGMKASRANSAEVKGLPSVAKNSMFLSYRNGLTTIVEALIESLRDSGTNIVTGAKVEGIARRKEGGYDLILGDGQPPVTADAVIVALPAYAAADLLSPLADVSELDAIRYVSVANIIMAFDRSRIDNPLDGSGFVVPRKEGRTITACTWTSSKWGHTSPDGKVLLRCYVGRAGDEAVVDLPDEEIIARVRRDIGELMGVTAEPLFYEITRLHRSMPQYPVGHLQSVDRLRKRLADQLPRVLLTGAAYEGVGLPDCIRQGRDTAKQVVDLLVGK